MNYLKNICVGLVFAGILSSCHDLIDENPKDFLTPENSFVDKAGFESSVLDIYKNIRNKFYMETGVNWDYNLIALDLDLYTEVSRDGSYKDHYFWNTITSNNNYILKWWKHCYSIVYAANVIIDRADQGNVKWTSETEKNTIIGEAKFLRAFVYRFLANIWGNVPLVIHETTSPQFNYTNTPQADIYKQCKEDLEFAIKWLPDIDKQQGGRASKVAAQHLLSEILIQMKDYDGAIKAASDVINNPAMSLMTERFGVLKNFKFAGYDYQGEKEPWGDVYWDLFRENNFNRIDGNKECIWNFQMDYDIEGGGYSNQWGGNFSLERYFGTNWKNQKDIDGIQNWCRDTLSGRPIEQLEMTKYMAELIWQYKGDFDRDIRNNKYNMRREYYWTNPASRFYGQPMTLETLGDKSALYCITQPTLMKAVTAVHHGRFLQPAGGQLDDLGRVYKDWYIMRLAETYLLRAEAYMQAGNLDAAAADINVLRNRAKATPVTAADVNIDLILDERARELCLEEFRANTLLRTHKFSEYLTKYNKGCYERGIKLDDHYNRWPIPYSEIEANKEGGLVQNPGW